MKNLDFKCIEKRLSKRIHKLLAAGELDRDLQDEWDNHLDLCHACREDEDLRKLIAEGVGFEEAVASIMPDVSDVSDVSGVSDVPDRPVSEPPRGLWGGRRRLLAYPATGALLAGVASVFLMNPHVEDLLHRGFATAERGDLIFQIEKPIEGEVLLREGGGLEWTAVEEANSYRITIETMDGERHWTGTATAARIDLPEPSEAHGDYMAIVEPIPIGLVREGQADVSFKRSSLPFYVLYRITHAPMTSILLLCMGVALGAAALIRRR